MKIANAAIFTAALSCALWAQTAAVSDFGGLQAQVAAGGTKVITVVSGFEVTSPLTIPKSANITIRSVGAVTLALSGGVSGSMFTIDTGAVFALGDHVTLAGRSGNSAPVVTVRARAAFTMNGGVITGNSSGSTDGAARCGGVGLADSSVFDMYGGAISGNSYTGGGGFGTGAGGVMVSRGAVFNMHGGEVSNNTNSYMSSSSSSSSNGAGGVYVSDGTFNMYGGTISGNRQTGNFNFAAAGGLYLANVSEFNMYGGTISGNSAVSQPSGDGIYNSATSRIEFSGKPVVSDGVYFHSIASSPSFAARLSIGEGGLESGALIVIQGAAQASQLAAGTNLTAPFDGLTAEMAKAFISRDKKFVGRVGGTAANPRVVWADNYDLSITPAENKIFAPAVYGYAEQTPYSVTISNTGLGQTNGLSISLSGLGASAFVLSREEIANIDPNESGDFTVAPIAGLDAGTYAAAVTVTGEYDISVSFNVSFTVTKASGAGLVNMTGWEYGSVPNSPSIADGSTPVGYTGIAFYEYKALGAGDDTYSSTKPMNAGKYIVRAALPASNNYEQHIVTTEFAIDKADLTVTAVSHVIIYGDAPPAYSAVYSGFVNGDNESVLIGAPTFNCSYAAGNPAGKYPITIDASGLSVGNYSITPLSGELTVVLNTDDAVGHVSITGWTYGAAPNAPVLSSTNGTANAVIQYKLQGGADDSYSNTPPVNAGNYTVRATFPTDGNFAECSDTANFAITKARLRIMAVGTTITYGDPVPDYRQSVFYSGLAKGDKAAMFDDQLIIECNYAEGDDAGEYAVKPSGITSNNYNIEFIDGVLTVERYITSINVTVAAKEYDGGTAAEAASAVIRYRYGGDDDAALFPIIGTAAFTDGNAGANKTVVFGDDWALGGAKAHNYSLIKPAKKTAAITPKLVAVRAGDITYNGKIYDGTDTVDVNEVSIVLSDASGIIAGDDVAASFVSAVLDDKNAGSRLLALSGITLRGAAASNYSLINASAVAGTTVRKRDVTVKADDRLVIITGVPNQQIAFANRYFGIVEGDDPLAVMDAGPDPVTTKVWPEMSGGGSYRGENGVLIAGVYPITPGVAVGSSPNYNYVYVGGVLTISDKVDVSGDIILNNMTAEYDGTPKAGAATYNGSGANITYRYIGTIANGDEYNSIDPPIDAGNYTVIATYEDDVNIGKMAMLLDITPKPVTIDVMLSGGKIYDGNTAADMLVSSSPISGVIDVDVNDVDVIPGAASFEDKNAHLTNIIVKFSGWKITGARSHNYALGGQPIDGAAMITPKPITFISGDDIVNINGKVYDGTTEAWNGEWMTAVSMGMISLTSASDIIQGDAIGISFSTAEFDSPNAGPRTVTVGGLTIRGDNKDNYTLSVTTAEKSGVVIEKRDLFVKAKDTLVISTGGSQTIAHTVIEKGFVQSDYPVMTGTPDIEISSDIVDGHHHKNESGVLIPGVYAVTPYNAVIASANYNVIYESGLLTISDKVDVTLDITLGDIFDEYDGDPVSVHISYDGAITPSDTTYRFIGTTAAGAEYNSSVPPTDAGSYTVIATYEDAAHIGKVSASLTIAPKPLTVDSVSHTKEFDGTRNASGAEVVLGGIVTGDEGGVFAISVAAAYTSTDASASSITITAVTLGGNRASNYFVDGLPDTYTVGGGIISRRINAYVSIDGWTYGGAAKSPTVIGTPLDYTGTIVYEYKEAGSVDDTYSATTPVNAGYYTVRAAFGEADNYGRFETSTDFIINKASQDLPYIPGFASLKNPAVGEPGYVAGLDIQGAPTIPRIPFDLSGITMDVSDTAIEFTPAVLDPDWAGTGLDNSDMANWEYKLGVNGAWQDSPVFRSLTPNTQYIIIVRMKETGNYLSSSDAAILCKTAVSDNTIRVTPDAPPSNGSPIAMGVVYIDPPIRDIPGRIALSKSIVSTNAEFSIITSEKSIVNVVIYDNLGNIVFRRSNIKNGEQIRWDLKNTSARRVASGTYLITAITKDAKGTSRYKTKVVVTQSR